MTNEEEILEIKKELSAKDLVAQLRKGKQLHDEFANELNTRYMLAGKLVHEWKEHFKLVLPPDPSTSTLQELDARLLSLHQEAAFLKACCQMHLKAVEDRNSSLYREKFTQLVADYNMKNQKLPAKDTLKVLAEAGLDTLQSVSLHAQIELEFWKEILEDLANARRLVENATLNLSVESKALQSQKYLDAMNTGPMKNNTSPKIPW